MIRITLSLALSLLYCLYLSPMDAPGTRGQKDCMKLADENTHLDNLYRESKKLYESDTVEKGYVTAIKCFIETYEKSPKVSHFYISTMYLSLLAIAALKRNQNPEYEPLPEMFELFTKAKALKNHYEHQEMVKQLKEPDPATAESNNTLLQKFIALKSSMERLGYTQSTNPQNEDELFKQFTHPTRTRERSRSNDYQGSLIVFQGKQLNLQAQKILNQDQRVNATLPETAYVSAQQNYKHAISLFIDEYSLRPEQAFENIKATLEQIIAMEQRRAGKENYVMSNEWEQLYDKIAAVKEKEVIRQNRARRHSGAVLTTWQDVLAQGSVLISPQTSQELHKKKTPGSSIHP